MKDKEIYIVLTDDWELRGNGEGNVEKTQVQPMCKLMDLYERYGFYCTFNVEVMQQLAMRKLCNKYPELKTQADAWDAAVLEAHRRGHDIQLHIHPQWKNAQYVSGKWKLSDNWNITKYEETDVRTMFTESIAYLKELLKNEANPLNLVGFRSGSWYIAPSDFILNVLIDHGIKIDTSIVAGFSSERKQHSVDYSNVERRLLPYYPDIKDARKIGNTKTNIICIQTFTYNLSLYYKFLLKFHSLLKKEKKVNYNRNSIMRDTEAKIKKPFYQKAVDKFKSQINIADISCMTNIHFECLYKNIMRSAGYELSDVIAIILTTHTKDIKNYDNLQKFISRILSNENIYCITISELYNLINKKMIPINIR